MTMPKKTKSEYKEIAKKSRPFGKVKIPNINRKP